jgi:hypothetical protein
MLYLGSEFRVQLLGTKLRSFQFLRIPHEFSFSLQLIRVGGLAGRLRAAWPRRRATPDGRGDTPGMARTKLWHRTAAEQADAMASVARLHADVETQRASARRAIRTRRASIEPPDEELILPLPTELEEPSNAVDAPAAAVETPVVTCWCDVTPPRACTALFSLHLLARC